MKNVMKKAWEIARNGQKKFGGKVKEYFAQALRMAWAICKKDYKMIGSSKQVAWAKEIRAIMIANLDEFHAVNVKKAANEKDAKEFTRIIEVVKDELFKVEKASTFIDNRYSALSGDAKGTFIVIRRHIVDMVKVKEIVQNA